MSPRYINHIYITISTFTFVRPYAVVPSRTVTLPIPAVKSQNFNIKSCLVCVKSEKYTYLVSLILIGSTRQGEAELRTLYYWARQSQATYVKTHLSVLMPPQCRCQTVVCVSTPRMYKGSGYFLVFFEFIEASSCNSPASMVNSAQIRVYQAGLAVSRNC